MYRAMFLVIPAVFLGACMVVPQANRPKTGAVATGAPLAVVDDLKVWTTTRKEKVGEAVHTDSRGNTVGTTNVYANRTRVHSKKVWYMVQGRERIDDEDFFRISGDTSALKVTQDLRVKAKKRSRTGHITMGAGLIASVAAIFIKQPLLRTSLALGGSAALGVGWYFAFSSRRMMQPEYHAVPRSVAERAARTYNEKLGASPGKTVGVGYKGAF